jgi:hypothetical protein
MFDRSISGEHALAGSGKKSAVRFKLGLAIGFAAGYYLGAKAGRARYEQIRQRAHQLRTSRPFEKLQAAIELGVERFRGAQEADVQLVLLDEEPVTA